MKTNKVETLTDSFVNPATGKTHYVVLAAVSIFLAPGISKLLGASEAMLPYCVLYLRINMIGIVFFMLQNLFQNFLIMKMFQKLTREF